jgi:hypothetical protein
LAEPIIGLNILYYSNTLATVTKGTVKFWDIEEILFSATTAELAFRVQPGYKAIEKNRVTSRNELKKKILIRGKACFLLACPTRYSNYMIAILSHGDRPSDCYLRLFYLSKFKILIKKHKLFEQIPRKLHRLLQ